MCINGANPQKTIFGSKSTLSFSKKKLVKQSSESSLTDSEEKDARTYMEVLNLPPVKTFFGLGGFIGAPFPLRLMLMLDNEA